jgi:hypothetical protein
VAPRSRSFTTTSSKGRIVTNGSLVAGGGDVWQATGSCSDQTGPGDCAPFTADKISKEGGRVNVFNNASNFWDNYEVDYFLTPDSDHLSAPLGADFTDVHYCTNGAARTNPSRPYVDVPVNILELGSRIRGISEFGRNFFRDSGYRSGRNVAQHAGNVNLLYQYGLAPIVGDIVKLTNFRDQLQRRMLELERLATPNGLRRTLTLGAWSTSFTQTRVMQSNQFFWTAPVTRVTRQTIRGHFRWVPENTFSSMSTTERQWSAIRALQGLTVDGSTLWESMPWSWLIDWGSNVGDWFKANRNIIPATLSGCHIMRETVTDLSFPSVSFGANGSQSPGKLRHTTKSRRPSFVAPIAHFPFLSGNQVGILASLAVTRM